MKLSRSGIVTIVIGAVAFAVLTFLDQVLYWDIPWVLEILCLVVALVGWVMLFIGRSRERKEAKDRVARQLDAERRAKTKNG